MAANYIVDVFASALLVSAGVEAATLESGVDGRRRTVERRAIGFANASRAASCSNFILSGFANCSRSFA